MSWRLFSLSREILCYINHQLYQCHYKCHSNKDNHNGFIYKHGYHLLSEDITNRLAFLIVCFHNITNCNKTQANICFAINLLHKRVMCGIIIKRARARTRTPDNRKAVGVDLVNLKNNRYLSKEWRLFSFSRKFICYVNHHLYNRHNKRHGNKYNHDNFVYRHGITPFRRIITNRLAFLIVCFHYITHNNNMQYP